MFLRLVILQLVIMFTVDSTISKFPSQRFNYASAMVGLDSRYGFRELPLFMDDFFYRLSGRVRALRTWIIKALAVKGKVGDARGRSVSFR